MNKFSNFVDGYQKYFVIIIFMFFAQMFFFSENSYGSSPPSFPIYLSGTIDINDNPAPVGTRIEAIIEETLRGTTTTSVVGVYGDSAWNKLPVTCMGNNIITFKAKLPGEDTYATSEQTLMCGSNKNNYDLDFVWDGSMMDENNAPVSNDIFVILDEDGNAIITLDSYDIDDDFLFYEIVDYPSSGGLSDDLSNIISILDGDYVVYVPELNYFGDDSFTYLANDGMDDSNIATVYITVNSVNDVPVAYNSGVFTSENIEKSINLSAFDEDGDDLSYIIVSDVGYGDVNIVDNIVTYTPDTNYNGDDFFTFKVNDGVVDSNVATISITVSSVNTAPKVSIPSSVSFLEDSSISSVFDLDDSVLDDGPISAIVWSYVGNTNVGVSIDGNNEVSFTSNTLNWYGHETITFIADDGQYTDYDSIIVFVNPINDVPVVTNMPDVSLMAGESMITLWTLDNYVFDVETPDSDLIWSHTGDNPVSISVNLNRTLSISAPVDWSGSETIIFSAYDGNLSDTGSFVVLVNPVENHDDEPPAFPMILSGTINVDGMSAPIGTHIDAIIEDTLRGETIVSVVGVYGNSALNKLPITCMGDNNISFKAKLPGDDTYVLSNQTILCSAVDKTNYHLEFVSDGNSDGGNDNPPGFPMVFYGNIYLDDISAHAGTVLEAWVGDSMRGKTTISVEGKYGNTALNKLPVTCNSGEEIQFKAKFPGNSTFVLSDQIVLCGSSMMMNYDLYFYRDIDNSSDDGNDTIPNNPPIFPDSFFGTITINGVPADVGTQITAYVSGDKRDIYTTTALGVYGQTAFNRFIVNGGSSDIGDVVEFYVDGSRAYQTSIWRSGDITEVNLGFITDGPPGFPMILSGTIFVDETSASIGTRIDAMVGDSVRGKTITSVVGVYGDTGLNKLPITCTVDEVITFQAKLPGEDTYVLSEQTLMCGSSKSDYHLDFVTGGVVIPQEPTAPSILSIEPSGVVIENRFNITVTTDMNASCRFDYFSKNYDSMSYDFETIDGLNHNLEVYHLNGNYDVYAHCMRDGLVSNPINVTNFVVSAPALGYVSMVVEANVSVNGLMAVNGSVIYAFIDGVLRDSAEVIDGFSNLTIPGDVFDNGLDVVFYLEIPGLENKSVSLQNISWINGSYVYENLTFEAHDVRLRNISNPSAIVSGSNVKTYVVLENTQNTNETVNVSFYVDGVLLKISTYDVGVYESKTVSSDWIASGVSTHKLSYRILLVSDQNELNDFIESQISVTSGYTGSSGGSSSKTFISSGVDDETNVSNYTVENIDVGDDDDDVIGDVNETQIDGNIADMFNPSNLFENTTETKKDSGSPTGFLFANPGTFAITAVILSIVVLFGVRFLIMARI